MPKFQGQADKPEVFKLPSAILEAYWWDREAYVNGVTTLEVRTAFVGDGSPIKVALKGKDGSLIEKLEGKIYGGMYRKQITLAMSAAGSLSFEAELPEHGLKSPIARLAVPGIIRLTNPAWKDAETGKAVSLLKRHTQLRVSVDVEGVPDGTEGSIHFMQKLDEHRLSEMAMLPCKVAQGKLALDWIFDYRKDTADLASQHQKDRTGETYKSPKVYFEAHCKGAKVKGPEADFLDFIRLELLDPDGLPLAKQKVRLTFPDGKTKDLEADEQGIVLAEDIKPGSFKLSLVDK